MERKKIKLSPILIFISILITASCSSIQAGLYLASMEDNGEAILNDEPYVKARLEEIIERCENYTIKVFARTGIGWQIRRTALLTHSYYVVICHETGEFFTLSYYGTKYSFHSTGAWALNANSDRTSYLAYLEGDNKWDVDELFKEKKIDVKQTLLNIIVKIDSEITYYYKDHITDKPNVENCNTALSNTIIFINDPIL